ncbi:5937_t:CDS:1, partial [Dentiscutata erythropus]
FINNNLIRLLYLARLFNVNNHIKCVRFLANEIEISYADDSIRQFCFRKLGFSEDLNFASKLSGEIDKLLEVSSDPHEDDKIFKV